jgi:hypothetical protein
MSVVEGSTVDTDFYGSVALPIGQQLADFRQARPVRALRTASTLAVPVWRLLPWPAR